MSWLMTQTQTESLQPSTLQHQPTPSRQKGSALFMALMILIVLSLLAVITSTNSVLQERMTGNFRDSSLAFEAAENSLRWAEAWVASRVGRNDPTLFTCVAVAGCGTTVVASGAVPGALEDGLEADWMAVPFVYGEMPSAPGTILRTLPEVAQQPRYVIEQVLFAPDNLTESPQTGTFYYNILARGVGARPTSIAVLRSVHTRRVD